MQVQLTNKTSIILKNIQKNFFTNLKPRGFLHSLGAGKESYSPTEIFVSIFHSIETEIVNAILSFKSWKIIDEI